MMKCKMKQVALAVGTVLGCLSAIPSAHAVNLATDGLGQVLIFPYYTTRAGWNTLLNITNTSDQVVVAKVRFHEAYNSRDVFDFNVIMSPHDVWNGTLSNGPGDVPVFSTSDTTCTVPAIPAGGQPLEGSGANALLAFTGSTAGDGGPGTTDRLREGYITVTMMGTAAATETLAANAVHTSSRVPKDCSALRSAFALSGTTIAALKAHFGYTGNPLKGAFSLVNATKGWNAASEAVTLANFFNPTAPSVGGPVIPNLISAQLPPASVGNVYNDSFHQPDLADANTIGTYLDTTGALVNGPANGAAAVLHVLARHSVVNQWANRNVATTGWKVNSDWIVTFPTKRFYTDSGNNEFAGRATGRSGLPAVFPAPFANFFSVPTAGQSCDPVAFRFYDREEQSPTTTSDAVFSPAPTPQGTAICAEANVLSFGATAGATATTVLGSPLGLGKIAANVQTPTNYENGWMRLDFTQTATTQLPVVGFSVINRTDPTGLLNESYIVDHAYIR